MKENVEIEFGKSGLYSNAILYDAVHSQFSGDVEFYRDRLLGKSCLEIGCGTGRLLIALKKSGVSIEGLDCSVDMLQRASDKLQALSLDVPLHLGNACAFKIDKTYDELIFPCNGLLHLLSIHDLRDFFESARRHLKSDGFLTIDIFNPDLRFLLGNGVQKNFLGKIDHEGSVLEIFESSFYDRQAQVNHVKWSYVDSTQRTIDQREFRQRIFFPQEIRFLCQSFGFRITGIFGDHNGGLYSASSPRQIIICQPT